MQLFPRLKENYAPLLFSHCSRIFSESFNELYFVEYFLRWSFIDPCYRIDRVTVTDN